MKGLIIKDLYCLKKEIRLFLGITIGSAIVSILFLLSVRHGNIADALADIQKTEMIGSDLLLSLTDMLALFVIYLPIALASSMVECFKEDTKAEFSKVMLSMPISYKKIVGSRYVTCLLFFGTCFLSATFCNVLVTSVSDTLEFISVLKGTFCACAIFMIYMSLIMFLLYLLGTKRADMIQSVPFLLVFFVGVIRFAKKMEVQSETEAFSGMFEMVNSGKEFMEKQGLKMFAIALFCMLLSYFLSVKILENKRGMI